MSPTGRNPNWDSIILRTLFASCLNWSKTGKNSKNPVKNRYNFFFYFFFQNKFVTLTMHVLRSVCPNGSQKQMHLACLTPNPKWVICLLPAKNTIYRYFTYVSVILRARGTLLYAILPIFVLRSYSNPSRAFIQTTSRLLMRAKCTYTGIPSRNPISSILNPYNFFLAGNFSTIFWKTS